MDNKSFLKGLLLFFWINSVASRPQYNYPGSVGNFGITSGVAAHGLNPQLQIIPSQPVSQTYLPPAQNHVQQPKLLAQNYFPPSQQYVPPLQSVLSPVQPAQQTYSDVSQIPLQTNHNSFSLGVSSYNNIGGSSQGFLSQSSLLNQQPTSLPQQQPKTIVTKDIFVHIAPPEAEEQQDFSRQLQSIPIRKNYRIIFIKAPTQNPKIAVEALKQAQAINEEKTIIYVLSKKADVADIQQQLSQLQVPQTVNRKPEVYFIKYKTNEEAQKAQKEIQAQYDALGGSTNISDEGIAPVIGALKTKNLSVDASGQIGSISAPNRKYLPPKV